MSLRQELNALVRVGGKPSLSRILLLVGIGQVLVFSQMMLVSILRLPDDLFVQALPSAAGLLAGITALLGAIYSWAKWLDRKNGNPESLTEK